MLYASHPGRAGPAALSGRDTAESVGPGTNLITYRCWTVPPGRPHRAGYARHAPADHPETIRIIDAGVYQSRSDRPLRIAGTVPDLCQSGRWRERHGVLVSGQRAPKGFWPDCRTRFPVSRPVNRSVPRLAARLRAARPGGVGGRWRR
ncbi:MAG: hypothetical protein AVDCRST_MAG33-1955 [uncultured Thermomicrobiales bacterium]|uniref:Uncharacterized protein n=1 Tax=uncultured Thermomicrobiales bacterium TaxID=1645740 RepID=A0A6J4V0Y4_9BACT|nr:MAG: hypothetical protein AVDCRST_MAG33-1955 [uncultured Thermomicrobiales bacterium]